MRFFYIINFDGTIKNFARMDKLLSYKTASLSVDFSYRFLLISWHGNVDFEEYKSVLTKATEIAEVHDITDVIINRLELRELNTECRVWMKNYFLKELVRPVIPNLTKVATIESRSAIGQIYAKTISKAVSMVYPNLTFRSFASESAAYRWINPGAVEPALQEAVAATANSRLQGARSIHREYPGTAMPQLEERRKHLLDSLYQLFFAAR